MNRKIQHRAVLIEGFLGAVAMVDLWRQSGIFFLAYKSFINCLYCPLFLVILAQTNSVISWCNITLCMAFIRKIKQRGKIYYAEVKNQWIDGKCVQKHIRSLGTDLENPTNIAIEQTHFSYLSLWLMQGSLTPNDFFEMLENMGQPVKK